MLILPKSKSRIVWYYFRKYIVIHDHIFVILTYLGSLASILTLVFKGLFWEPGNRLYVGFLSLFAFLAIIYCRNYYKEKHQRYKYQNCHELLHEIGHELRAILTPNSSESYKTVFERYSKNIVDKLCEILLSFGYPIDDVCIKMLNIKKGRIRVVARANPKRAIPDIDNVEAVSDNPFVRLLLRVHTNHDNLLSGNAELMKIPYNKKFGKLSFFSIGNIRSKNLPLFVNNILPKQKGKAEYNQANFLSEMHQRIGDRYNSCAGFLVTTKPERQELENRMRNGEDYQDISLENYVGMIGFDSKDKKLFESFDEHLFHLIALVADMLYPAMVLYQREVDTGV